MENLTLDNDIITINRIAKGEISMIFKTKNLFYKAILLVLSLVLLLNLVACQRSSGSTAFKTDDYKEFGEEVDEILSGFSINLSELEEKLPMLKEFNKSDAERKSVMALEMARDMAIVETFGLTTDEMFILSGEAVKAYPHPLLLNNFGAMVYNRIGEEEGLNLFLLALNQEPENPIILTNIANVFIEREDFTSAEEYAKRALQTQDDYGPAYQVMTTIHLKNENSMLAAETMIKSAKHCFNDVTMYHFDSFLSAVDSLNPLVDEYPLKEEFLDLLYTIAKENVDTLETNSSIDTPEAQLKLKSFPQITSVENLSNSYKYLDEELRKIMDLQYASIQLGMDYVGDYNDYFYSIDEGKDGVYPVKKNIRQAYAYEVIKSFYEFKIDKVKAKYLEEDSKRYSDFQDRYNNIDKAYEEKLVVINEEVKKVCEEWGKGSIGVTNLEDAINYLFTDFIMEGGEVSRKVMNLYVEECEIVVSKYKDFLDIQEQDSNSVLTSTHKKYNEIKQILEEYWLKSSGILKYISDEGLFYHYVSEREVYVYNEIYDSIHSLSSEAISVSYAKNELHHKETVLENARAAATGVEAAMAEARKWREHNGGDTTPDMERQELSTFPEKNVIGDLQIGGSFFGLFGGSASFDGESLKITGETPWEEVGYKKNFYTGETTVHSLTGVKAEGDMGWFTNKKAVKEALSKAGKLGKLTKILGKMGFGYSNAERSGPFVTMDSRGNITDRGTIYSKSQGGQVFDVGKSDEFVVEKSYATGLSTTSTSSRYGFKFISISR